MGCRKIEPLFYRRILSFHQNQNRVKTFFLLSLFIVTPPLLLSCRGDKSGGTETSPTGGGNNSDPYDVDANGIPKFVAVNYIELQKIERISKFRSSFGHDYPDAFESCRNMKHYFNPKSTVSRIFDEWAGTQVQIRSQSYPAFFFIIFHVNLSSPLSVGDTVRYGQQLGMHIGSQTMSDIAAGVNTPTGWKLVSYFDVMTDALFQAYHARGLNARSDVIISKAARDADPLTCNGETFTTTGSLGSWVNLN